MTLDSDGAELIAGALDEVALESIETALAGLPTGRPGVRIFECDSLRVALASGGPIGTIAASRLGAGCRAVRAILFDKSEQANWALGWHQDRTIAVAERIDVPGFGPWSVKAGIPHVEPPIELLERMVTLRIHLDPVDQDNAPLLIAPGSHRFGGIAESEIDDIAQRCGSYACTAKRGDIWVYKTLILHASEAARRPRRRRVLQLDYSAVELPAGLQFHMA